MLCILEYHVMGGSSEIQNYSTLIVNNIQLSGLFKQNNMESVYSFTEYHLMLLCAWVIFDTKFVNTSQQTELLKQNNTEFNQLMQV